MNAIDIAIAKLQKVKGAIGTIGKTMAPYAEGVKHDELRLGHGPNGNMPTYKDYDYYQKKLKMSSYIAGGGRWDLFVDGDLHDGITAIDIDNIIYIGNSEKSPSFAVYYEDHTDGISNEASDLVVEEAEKVLTSQISEILNV